MQPSIHPQTRPDEDSLEISVQDRKAMGIGNQIKAIVDAVVDGILHTVNPAAERIFGCQAAERIGHNVNELMPVP